MKTMTCHMESVIDNQTKQINDLLAERDELKSENRELRYKVALLFKRIGIIYNMRIT